MQEQPLVYVSYGRCGDLPPLTGIGKITDEKERYGLTWVYVEPVEGLPFGKWYTLNEVQYVLNAEVA